MPAARSQFRAHPLAYAGLASLFLFSLTAFARHLSDSVDLIRHLTEYVRPPFYLGDANWGAVELQPEAEAVGMEVGDVGTRRERPADRRVFRLLRHPSPVEARAIACEYRCARRDPGTLPPAICRLIFAVSQRLRPPARLFGARRFRAAVIVLPVVCLALGFWVAAVRIGDRSAWLLLVLLLSLSIERRCRRRRPRGQVRTRRTCFSRCSQASARLCAINPGARADALRDRLSGASAASIAVSHG